MTRRLLATMVTIILALLLFPASSLAAASAAPAVSITTPDFSKTPDKKALDKIKTDMLTLVKDRPTGGKTISLSALDKTLAPYRAKFKIGSGNSFYTETFTGDYAKQNGKWALGDYADVTASWVQDTTTFTRMEKMTVKSFEEDKEEGMIDCTLMTSDKAFSYIYTWVKFTKNGQVVKMPKTSSQVQKGSTVPAVKNDGTGRLYPDQTVNGQLCKVYSLGTGENETIYWLSTTKGFDIKTATFSSAAEQAMTYRYEMKKVSKDAGFYNPPGDVNFISGGLGGMPSDWGDETSNTSSDIE